jgi:DNA adenine methylase
MKFVRPLIKLPNEKWPIRQWLAEHLPPDYEQMTYVEPFGGGANLLFMKKPSHIEIVNDTNTELTNILVAVRDEPHELIRRMNLYKCCPESFEKLEKKKQFEDYLDQAVHDLLLRKMSRNGQKKAFAKPSNPASWKNGITSIQHFADRLREVFVLNKCAFELIQTFDAPNVLLYVDPPYLHDSKSKELTISDMSIENHMEMNRLLAAFKGKVILSGVMSPLYKRLYSNWNMAKKRINTSSKETEIVWKNF